MRRPIDPCFLAALAALCVAACSSTGAEAGADAGANEAASGDGGAFTGEDGSSSEPSAPDVGGGGDSVPTPGSDSSPASDGGVSSDAASGSDGGGGLDASPASPGYFHTNGAQIVDASGQTVRLTGLSWFGLETSNFAPHGLWARSMSDLLDVVQRLGFNMIRVPYSNQLFDPGSTPNGIDASKNPDLVGLDGLHILDKLIAGAKARGLRVVLDRHRPDSSAQSELWYTSAYSEARWIDDWKMLATRYKGDPTVIGFDLHNEPHGSATWGDGNLATDWRLAAERAGNAVQGVNPDLLIIVEGIERIGGDSYWWGGNLAGAKANPVRLQVANRLVYSPHDYPASVYSQTWFSDPSYPANLPGVWDSHWGYLVKEGIAPVWIGEFGTKDQTDVDRKWFRSIASYIQSNGFSESFWCLNPNSGDTGGILADDWVTVQTDKMDVLTPTLAPTL